MPDKFLQTFTADFSTGSHVWRMSEDILEQMRLVSDDTPETIFKGGAERLDVTRSSLYKSVSPYCNLLLGPTTIVSKSIEGMIEIIRIPVTLQCVFKVGPRNSDGTKVDVQGWSHWLQERAELYLQPYNSVDNEVGLVKTVPWIWNWSSGSLDKTNTSRSLTELGTNGGQPLTGSAYSLNLTYDVDVWPTHPL